MTLIAGLRCSDGILVCSDREESGGAENGKQSVSKVFDYYAFGCSVAIATAGHAALCDVAVDRIRTVSRSQREKFVPNHQAVISEVLRGVHEEYVWHYTGEQDRRFALVIGLYDDHGEDHLYLTDEEILHPKLIFACSGVGELIGSYFLERLFDHTMNVDEAQKLMAFIAKEAKDSVSSVGRETEMVTLHKHSIISRTFYARGTDREIPHLLHCMTKFWKGER